LAPILSSAYSRAPSTPVARKITQGIIILCFSLPLAFFPGLINLYRLPKIALLALLTSLLCWLWLLDQSRRKASPPALPLFFPLLFYLLVATLSFYRTINPFQGSILFFLPILGIALFWLTVNYIDSEKIAPLFHWTVISGTIMSLLGIAQVWGADIPTLIPTGGPGATFGNKNMAAHFLLFVLPVSFYLLLSSSEPAREWFYATFAGLMATYFIYTGTRAAWGGAMVGLLVLWFCMRASGLTPREIVSLQKRKIAFLTGITIFVLAMNLFPPYFLPGWRGAYSESPLARLGSMIELEQNLSAQSRFAIWANSLAIFKDHPLLGVGKGNFRFIYPLYAQRVIRDSSFGLQSRADDAHNDYVQLLAETGVLGALAFALILILLSRRLWQGLKKPARPQLFPITFALAAILVEAFWDFPFNLPVPQAFFWIYSAIVWSLTRDSEELPQGSPRAFSRALVILLALTVTCFAVFMLSSLRGELYYSRGDRAFYQGRLAEAERDLKRAIQARPSYPAYHAYLGRYHFLYGLLMLREENYPPAIVSFRRSLALDPYDINTLNNLGVAYASAGDSTQAIRAFEVSIRIWPHEATTHRNLGTIYALRGERDKAIHHFHIALSIDPEDPKALAALRRLEKP